MPHLKKIALIGFGTGFGITALALFARIFIKILITGKYIAGEPNTVLLWIELILVFVAIAIQLWLIKISIDSCKQEVKNHGLEVLEKMERVT
jgi:hypothetical protein